MVLFFRGGAAIGSGPTDWLSPRLRFDVGRDFSDLRLPSRGLVNFVHVELVVDAEGSALVSSSARGGIFKECSVL